MYVDENLHFLYEDGGLTPREVAQLAYAATSGTAVEDGCIWFAFTFGSMEYPYKHECLLGHRPSNRNLSRIEYSFAETITGNIIHYQITWNSRSAPFDRELPGNFVGPPEDIGGYVSDLAEYGAEYNPEAFDAFLAQ